jgi:hypothetical protein
MKVGPAVGSYLGTGGRGSVVFERSFVRSDGVLGLAVTVSASPQCSLLVLCEACVLKRHYKIIRKLFRLGEIR